MDRSNVIYLISKTYAPNDFGQYEETKTERMVYCDVRSVTRDEWYEAGRQGFRPEFEFVMFRPDYHGENEVKFRDRYYSIYRTYVGRDEDIELYVQEIAGIKQTEEPEPDPDDGGDDGEG